MRKRISRRQALLGFSSTLLLPAACSTTGGPTGSTPRCRILPWRRQRRSRSRQCRHMDPRQWLRSTGRRRLDRGGGRGISEGSPLAANSRPMATVTTPSKLSSVDYRRVARITTVSTSALNNLRPAARGRWQPATWTSWSSPSPAVQTTHSGISMPTRSIANDPDVDVVAHLGDYIYEYSEDGYGGETGRRIGRVHEPRHEIVTLDDYRTRHAQYKSDPGSRAMHARHPLDRHLGRS